MPERGAKPLLFSENGNFPSFSSSEKLFEIWIRKLMAGSETQEY
jgi:hypothetical protein